MQPTLGAIYHSLSHNQLSFESINQPINQSINQSINRILKKLFNIRCSIYLPNNMKWYKHFIKMFGCLVLDNLTELHLYFTHYISMGKRRFLSTMRYIQLWILNSIGLTIGTRKSKVWKRTNVQKAKCSSLHCSILFLCSVS